MIPMQAGHRISDSLPILACQIDTTYAFPPNVDVLILDAIYYVRTDNDVWVLCVATNWLVVLSSTDSRAVIDDATFTATYAIP